MYFFQDLRASNTTPQLAFETSTYLNNHSPLLTESSHNLVEQTFGEFNKNTLSPKATSSKSKKYVYYSHMSAWKEKRKHIKKQQKMKRITIDKLQENSYIISEIESFSTLAVPGNNTQKFDTINIGNMSNNNLSIENFHNAK